ncbi:hypothetical protein NQ176_g5988 [Zarea fungicola]|uniref:Uncharacterized protein n=1 Tax=Zarea fungicola TaxID=93591 RepID=A0ACC1N5K2_9HYPO|nr:hypothetical protein NQ176_g5988 [Lecanicillium fungicola]
MVSVSPQFDGLLATEAGQAGPKPTHTHGNGVAYPKWIGQKFDANGHVLPFSGNTILSYIDKASPFFSALSEAHQELSRWPYASSFAMLPPSSYHVTIMQGVCEPIRTVSNWPRDLPLTAELAECTSHFLAKLSSSGLTLGKPVRMRIHGWRPLENNIGLRLVPATETDAERLSRFRDALADELKLRLPGHEEYELHCTLAYSLRLFDDAQNEAMLKFLGPLLARFPEFVEIGAPDLCVFENMFKYDPLYTLGS